MLLLVLHVLLFVKFLKSFHGKIKIIDYLLQWECPSLDQDLAEQNMKNHFIHQTSEDGHPVMSNKSASNFAMDEYLVSLQLKGKSELTHDETISNHVQQLSPAGDIVSRCYAATFSPFPLLSHSLHHRIPELCHSLLRPRALYVPWDQKGTDRLTAMNQSWILPFDLSPFYHYPSDSASEFGKLHGPGKAQRGNIWAELSWWAHIPQSLCWWC